jgi:hypothetical protein
MTDKMPAWMRQFLAVGGFDWDFTINELALDQLDLFEFACHLADMQKADLIEIIYDT